MNEDFLSYIWQFKLYGNNAELTDKHAFEVISPGQRNFNSGPDFSNARIKIDGTLWAGDVEIHIKSSDWMRHGHKDDYAYETVILHIVYEHDLEIQAKGGGFLPVLELKHFIDPNLYTRYLQFLASDRSVPCGNSISDISGFPIEQWLPVLGIERFMRKNSNSNGYLENSERNWREVFYTILCRSMGSKINDDAFEMLAHALPLKYVLENQLDKDALEAMLFGQSGLLYEAFSDSNYVKMLIDNYDHYKRKYSLNPLESHIWKFMRTRPSNFPNRRIALLSSVLSQFDIIYRRIFQGSLDDMLKCLESLELSKYWQSHYRFNQPANSRGGGIGKDQVRNLIINAIVPYMILYSGENSTPALRARAVEWLTKIGPESNSIIKKWRSLGISPANALESQALLELFNEYCRIKRCLDCRIGHHLLKTVAVKNEICKTK